MPERNDTNYTAGGERSSPARVRRVLPVQGPDEEVSRVPGTGGFC